MAIEKMAIEKMVIGEMGKIAIKKPIKLSAYEGQLKRYL